MTDEEQESPLELDSGQIPVEESDPDLDPGEIQPKRPWLEEARYRLFYGLRRIRRYGRFGLSYTRYYVRLGEAVPTVVEGS